MIFVQLLLRQRRFTVNPNAAVMSNSSTSDVGDRSSNGVNRKDKAYSSLASSKSDTSIHTTYIATVSNTSSGVSYNGRNNKNRVSNESSKYNNASTTTKHHIFAMNVSCKPPSQKYRLCKVLGNTSIGYRSKIEL